MSSRSASLALLVLSTLAATACGDREADRPTYDDPAQPIEAASGAEFDLRLVSNHSTGYEWVLVDSSGLGPLRVVGSRYAVPRHLRDRDGAGGHEWWTIASDGPGNGVVSLIYVRPWENQAPKDTTRFRVTVR
jgi:predicted secreted protein